MVIKDLLYKKYCIKRILGLLCALSFFTGCESKQESYKKKPLTGLIADKAMVVSARKEASEIGSAIMQQGGNAFDAMIATEFALAVAYPFAGNIGGGGFMVYRQHDGSSGALDYREKAPLAASHDMYLDKKGNIIPKKSTLGAMAVGVPGTVAGLYEVYKKFGTFPFRRLVQPAIDLAYKGVVVTKKQAKRLAHFRVLFAKVNKRTIYLDKDWKHGDTIKHPILAKTLISIRDMGRDGFYKGKTAHVIVDYLKRLGGIITEEDLIGYKAQWRTPVEFQYKGNRVISMSPPSSGGICIAQILKSIEPYNIGQYKHHSIKYIQLLTEAERRSYADRSYFLGDPDFIKIPLNRLISEEYLKSRMTNFSWNRATKSSEVSHGSIAFSESNETTHYSIVDPFGNAVSVTTTLNGAYGSKVYVKAAGFFLNNEMDDFSIKPGKPNMFGLVGGKANSIAPEKRMLSSMSPTILEKQGKLKMVLGSPGGSMIITSVVQNILNILEYDMTMQESVSMPRFHHQWLPDEIKFERSFNFSEFEKLKSLGYKIDQSDAPIIGKIDAILIQENGQLEGGADPRGDDKAVGF